MGKPEATKTSEMKEEKVFWTKHLQKAHTVQGMKYRRIGISTCTSWPLYSITSISLQTGQCRYIIISKPVYVWVSVTLYVRADCRHEVQCDWKSQLANRSPGAERRRKQQLMSYYVLTKLWCDVWEDEIGCEISNMYTKFRFWNPNQDVKKRWK